MTMQRPSPRRIGGYTLTELAVVIAVLALVAAIVAPGPGPADQPRLDLGAGQLAAAIRHARDLSLRSGTPHGFRQPTGSSRIEVFRLDTSTVPATPVFDVRHPLDKTLYRVELGVQQVTSIEDLARDATYRGTCAAADDTWFDVGGTPRCLGGGNALVDTYRLTLTLGTSARTVELAGITGRVVVR